MVARVSAKVHRIESINVALQTSTGSASLTAVHSMDRIFPVCAGAREVTGPNKRRDAKKRHRAARDGDLFRIIARNFLFPPNRRDDSTRWPGVLSQNEQKSQRRKRTARGFCIHLASASVQGIEGIENRD